MVRAQLRAAGTLPSGRVVYAARDIPTYYVHVKDVSTQLKVELSVRLRRAHPDVKRVRYKLTKWRETT